MAISFVSDDSWSGSSSSSSFTLRRPSGISSGDFLVAILSMDTFENGGGNRSVTPPSGWTSQGHVYSSPNCVIDVMTKTVDSDEPSSWTGSLSSSSSARASIVAAYRGVSGLADDGTRSTGSSTSFRTATVNNPTTTNWRIVAAAYVSSSVSYQIESNESVNTERVTSDGTNEAGIWDSNGTIGTGNTNRTVSRGAVWESAASWIGILDAVDGAEVDGPLTATMPLISVSMDSELGYSGTMAATALLPTMTASGIATPPEGPLDIAITPVMTVSAATDASGTLDTVVLPVINFVTETRKFGIRVVVVEAEARRIVPLLGADTVTAGRLTGRMTQEAAGGDLLRVRLPLPQVSFDG